MQWEYHKWAVFNWTKPTFAVVVFFFLITVNLSQRRSGQTKIRRRCEGSGRQANFRRQFEGCRGRNVKHVKKCFDSYYIFLIVILSCC